MGMARTIGGEVGIDQVEDGWGVIVIVGLDKSVGVELGAGVEVIIWVGVFVSVGVDDSLSKTCWASGAD